MKVIEAHELVRQLVQIHPETIIFLPQIIEGRIEEYPNLYLTFRKWVDLTKVDEEDYLEEYYPECIRFYPIFIQ